MSTERERKKAAAREREKKERAKAGAERRARMAAAAKAEAARNAAARADSVAERPLDRTSASAAAGWPILEAWISEAWEDPTAAVHGVLIRGPGPEDRHAVGVFTYDPRVGLTDTASRLGASLNSCRQLLVARAEGAAMLSCTPEDLAALLRKAQRASAALRSSLPDGHAEVSELLADLDPNDALLDIDVDDTEDEDTEEGRYQPTSTWDRLRRWFGG
jgi:hypothetical protein